jgi:hypothetical protein
MEAKPDDHGTVGAAYTGEGGFRQSNKLFSAHGQTTARGAAKRRSLTYI